MKEICERDERQQREIWALQEKVLRLMQYVSTVHKDLKAEQQAKVESQYRLDALNVKIDQLIAMQQSARA